MKLKYKLLIISLLFSVAGLQFAVNTPVQAADLTKKEKQACFDKYDGHGTGRGTDGKFDSQMSKQYERDKCDRSKGGNCTINGSSQGGIVNCTDPSAASNDKKEGDESETSPVGSEYDSGDCSRGVNGDCKLIDLIVDVTNVITAMAGVVIVAMIIWGGIQYSMAGADAAKIQAAKQKITNALLALLLLIFGFSIIQWLVPGGLI